MRYKIMRTISTLLLLAICPFFVSTTNAAQEPSGIDLAFTSEQDDLKEDVPDHILGQLVLGALIEQVRPADEPTQVVIAADGLSWSWIPTIENVEFRIVPWKDRRWLPCEGVEEYVFFERLEKIERGYRLAVATTDGCKGEGLWYTVRWRTGGLVRDRGWSMFGFDWTPCRVECPSEDPHE